MKLPQRPTREEQRAAVRELMDNGNRKPLRKLYRRAFWYGFTHPFGTYERPFKNWRHD